MINKLFTNEKEQQICDEYFSKEEPSTLVLARKWNCSDTAIRNAIIRRGFSLRTHSKACKGIIGENNPAKRPEVRKKIKEALKNPTILAKLREKFKGENNPAKRPEVREKIREKVIQRWKDPKERKKLSDLRKGDKNPFYNHHHSEEFKRKDRERVLLRIQNNPGPFKDTKPELKMKEILNELNIPFEHQFRLGNHLFDFHILNTNFLIEVDGDYYHGNTKKFIKLSEKQLKQYQKDIKNEKLVKENNFILLRFWESDILNNTEKVKSIICSKIVR